MRAGMYFQVKLAGEARTRLYELGKGHDEGVAGKGGAQVHQVEALLVHARALQGAAVDLSVQAST